MSSIPPTSFSTTPPPLGDSPENHRLAYGVYIQDFANSFLQDPSKSTEYKFFSAVATEYTFWAKGGMLGDDLTSAQALSDILAGAKDSTALPCAPQYDTSKFPFLKYYFYFAHGITPQDISNMVSHMQQEASAAGFPDPFSDGTLIPPQQNNLNDQDIAFINAFVSDPQPLNDVLHYVLKYYPYPTEGNGDYSNLLYHICVECGDRNEGTDAFCTLYGAMQEKAGSVFYGALGKDIFHALQNYYNYYGSIYPDTKMPNYCLYSFLVYLNSPAAGGLLTPAIYQKYGFPQNQNGQKQIEDIYTSMFWPLSGYTNIPVPVPPAIDNHEKHISAYATLIEEYAVSSFPKTSAEYKFFYALGQALGNWHPGSSGPTTVIGAINDILAHPANYGITLYPGATFLQHYFYFSQGISASDFATDITRLFTYVTNESQAEGLPDPFFEGTLSPPPPDNLSSQDMALINAVLACATPADVQKLLQNLSSFYSPPQPGGSYAHLIYTICQEYEPIEVGINAKSMLQLILNVLNEDPSHSLAERNYCNALLQDLLYLYSQGDNPTFCLQSFLIQLTDPSIKLPYPGLLSSSVYKEFGFTTAAAFQAAMNDIFNNVSYEYNVTIPIPPMPPSA